VLNHSVRWPGSGASQPTNRNDMNLKDHILTLLLGLGTSLVLAQPPSSLPALSATEEVRIFNASRINTEGLEFCPAIYENGLVYVSRYKNGPVDPRTGETFFELFYAELDPNGLPGRPQSFSTEINSAYHEGPVSFNRQGDRIFFTRTNMWRGVRRADRRGRSGLKIYEAERGLFDWENIVELPFNSDNFSCMHPALSADESKLFFASNRPGGYGGMDLYVSEWRDGQWQDPINLGPEVNTSENEAFPFFHESGVLFFASEGHSGRGGLDLFLIDMSGRKWGQVYSLGSPFNSAADDLGLVLLPDGQRGYFTSSREGGFGQDDIYMFFAPQGLQGIKPAPVLNAAVTVTDFASSRRLAGASIRLFELNEDGLINDDGAYDMELIPGETPGSDLTMQMVRKSEEDLGSPLAVTNRNGEAIIPVTPGKEYLLLVSKDDFFSQELQFLATENGPDQPLEFVLEPTDCILLAGLVRSDRFQIPVPNATLQLTNLCDNSISFYRSNIQGEYEICLPMGCDFVLEATKEGYTGASTQVTTVRLRGSRSLRANIDIHPTSDAVLREPIREGTVIVLENIYYDFNKSSIRRGAATDLEALAKLMERYPSMMVELGAHTDSRGPADYNQDLSERRAAAAKEFMVQRGIAPERIRTVGYGESKLRNHCADGVNCTEEEHRLNRRTEVRVLSINERVQVAFPEEE
jgi:outer membrane protein OmpA-like peptidoglycan-associated protein